jgi:3',5'-cyclic AMP phosphodiesterase CpdA
MKNIIAAIIIISAVTLTFPAVRARAETLKIGFVTDWEYGSQKEYDHKLPKKAGKYLKLAVSHYNNVFKPDLVVGGGDYILARNIKKKKASQQMRYINSIFMQTDAPRLYCFGNHDVGLLSKNEIQQNLGINYNHSVTDINGVRVITLDTNDLLPGKIKYETNGRISSEELAWLDDQLNTDLQVIIFAHHSPVLTPNGKHWSLSLLNSEEVRAILEKYGNVVAVFSGHKAVNYATKRNGINYVVINNLSDKKALGSYADISIDSGTDEIGISVSQFGKKPVSYSFSKTLSTN